MSNSLQLAEYPFKPKEIEIDGHRLSYVDEGAGLPIVMVHGNPTWSYMYRHAITSLRAGYRVIAPDHIGCGLSEKPQSYVYTLQNHIKNLDALLTRLEIKCCVLMVHDWGGAIGMGWAGRNPDKVAGVVVLNTAAFRSQRIPFRIGICRWPFLGEFLVRGLNGFAGAATSMAVHKKMTSAVKKGFLFPYDNWHNRVAVFRFVQDIPLSENHPSWQELLRVETELGALKEKPMLICWGGRDFCFNDHFYEEWQQRFPHAHCHYFPDSGHYILEDSRGEVLQLVSAFLEKEIST